MLFAKGDRIVFMGDSISDYERKRPVGEGLFGGWGTSYVADIGCLLNIAYPDLELRVTNMGISGNTSRDLDGRWEADVLALKPDWVSVLIGINDVWRQYDSPVQHEEHVHLDEYIAHYERIIEKTLPVAKGMILMTPYYIEPNPADAMRHTMDEYGAAVKALAEKYHLVFVDTQAAWEPLLKHMHSTNIAWDRVHPNPVGHMQLARAFLDAVGYDWARRG